MIAFVATKILPDDPRHPFYAYLQQAKKQEAEPAANP